MDKFKITELFLVMADKERTYAGVLLREKDICRGSVIIDEGIMISMATTEKTLTQNLNNMCKLKLDHNLHKKAGKSTKIMESESFLN